MKTFLLAGASLVAGGVATFATAQPAVQPPSSGGGSVSAPAGPKAQPGQPESSPAADQSTGDIKDIIVTATRREEKLQKIPVTVTAITSSTLADAGVTEVRQLSQLAPGLTYTRAAALGQPVIRGVGSTGVSNGDESNVATYIDGVYQADPYATQLQLVNVDHIEVLRGPQGTVFGRNATGGLINIITTDPSFVTKGTFNATYGTLRNTGQNIDLRGYVTGPLTDTIAADGAVVYRHDGDYIKNLLTGGAVGHNEVYALRGKLLFEPNSRNKFILTADYSGEDGQSGVYQAIGRYTRGATVPGFIEPTEPWQVATDVLPDFSYHRYSVSLRSSSDLGFANLETTGAYNFSHSSQLNDSDGSNIPVAAAKQIVRSHTYSEEIRLLSNGSGRLTWLVGGYGFYLDSPAQTTLENSIPGPPAPLVANVLLEPTVTTTSFAGFGQVTYQLLDKLFITAGARYTTERRTFFALFNERPFLPSRTSTEPTAKVYDKGTYEVSARYQITGKTNLYASYGTGFKSGVFNTVTTVLNVVNPETIGAVEAGVKSDITSRLRVNLSAYDYDYNNLQVSARSPSGNGTFLLQNAARAGIYGSELEVTVVPIEDLDVAGFITYTHARYDSFPDAQVYIPSATGANTAIPEDVSGKQMVRTPEWTFDLRPNWRHDISSGQIQVGGSAFYSTRVFWDFADTKAFSQKPYTLVGAFAAFKLHDGWRFELSSTNLFNARVAQQISIGSTGTTQLLEKPQTIMLSAGYRF